MEISFHREMGGFMSEIFQNILITEAVPPGYSYLRAPFFPPFFFQNSLKTFTSTQSCDNESPFDYLVTGSIPFFGF